MLHSYLCLLCVYNIHSPVHLIIDLQNMEISDSMQICLLDYNEYVHQYTKIRYNKYNK
jgi:hypothetical protein